MTVRRKPATRAGFLRTGVAGFEPTHGGVKVRCLTTWLHPIGAGSRLCREAADAERFAAPRPLTIPERAAQPKDEYGTVAGQGQGVKDDRRGGVYDEQREDERPEQRARADDRPGGSEPHGLPDLGAVPMRSRLAIDEVLVDRGRPQEIAEGGALLFVLRARGFGSDRYRVARTRLAPR